MNNRIRYIDGLRGFTMLLVVYHHLCYLAFPPDMDNASILNSIGMTFRMPLFFFISGFFLYSENYTSCLFIKRAKNRLAKQLYPTIIVAIVYCLTCLDTSLLEMCYDPAKGGYWFTIVSVYLFFAGATLLTLFNRMNLSKKKQIVMLLLAGSAGFLISAIGSKYNLYNTPTWRLFCLYNVCYYILFFFTGAAFKIAYNRLKIKFIRGGVNNLLCIRCSLD